MTTHALVLLLQSLSRAASGGPPTTFSDAGPAASAIAKLGVVMIVIAAIVFIVVVTLLVMPMLRSRDADAEPIGRDTSRDPEERARERRWIVFGGALVPMLILTGVFALSLATLRAGHAPDPAFDVEVIGHQWWWEVRYPHEGLTTANEVHIPVGRPVRVRLESGDVIHSFWVPELQGKTDAITGQTNETWLQASRTGVFRGECAEFCGLQHAHMAFVVVADSPADYATWLANEQRLARVPTDSSALAGQKVFLTSSCSYCHAVRGTPAGAHVGPDLTHLASRRTLASGTIDFTRGNLAAWILNPDRLKPGTKMPPVPMDGAQLGALVAYLETLK